MADRRRAREWPLAIFTLALQCGCGMTLAAAFAEWKGSAPEMRPLGLAAFPIVAAGILASLLHLGRPLSAWKSLTNPARSRLSREIWLAGTFAVAALAYGAMWLAEGGELRGVTGVVTALLGVIAVASSASLYVLPARPFWRASWLTLSFVAATLLLGGLAAAMVARPGLLRGYMAVASAGAVLLLISAALMMARWLRLRRRGSADPVLEVWPPGRPARRNWLASALYLLLAGVTPLLLSVWLWLEPGAVLSAATPVITFAAALAGVALGRMLMFWLPDSLARF
jgi:DMSO reductase anchor subunit